MRAAIYARISSDREGSGLGVERQTDDCMGLCKRNGWTVTHVLTDNDLSAYSGKTRPDYSRLLDLVRNQEIDVIVAWHTDRLHRRFAELVTYIDVLKGSGVTTHTVKAGELDLSTPSGMMIARIHGAVDEAYVAENQIKLRRAKEQSAVNGMYNGGSRWYGYALDAAGVWRGPTTIDPDQADVLQEARQRYARGEPIYRITKDLNQRQLYNPGGTPWRQHNLLRLLLNPRYAGVRVHNGQRYAGTWPAIFTLAEHEELLACRTSEQRMKTWPKSPTGARTYLLTGFTECGSCGGPMRGNARRQGTRHYRRYVCCACRGIFRIAEPLELLVSEAVRYRLDSADLARLLTHQNVSSGDMVSLTSELEAKSLILNNLIDDYASGLLDRAQFGRAKAIAETSIRAAETAMQQAVGKWTNLHIDVGQTVREAYERGDLAWKRRLHSLLIDKVIVKPSNTGGRTAEHLWRGFRFSPADIEIVWLV